MHQQGSPRGAEYWLERRDGTLILLPHQPDLHKLYIEPTTACNLHCRICMRNVWEDPVAYMDVEVFRWPVKADAWVMWGTLDLPRMHWGAEQRCRFVQDRSAVIGWDGGVSPCYALAHTYSYIAIDGRHKQVARYVLGNITQCSLLDIWTAEDYCRFRNEVRDFHFPSCPDCDLRETCDLREQNKGCWGWNPSCADCLWAQDLVRCP